MARLADGRTVVLKEGPRVSAEARMLNRLADVGADTTEVLGSTDGLLVLTWLPPTPPTDQAWYRFGSMLRRVHSTAGRAYGWQEDYAFGSVPIKNTSVLPWPKFWGECRIEPLLDDLPVSYQHRLFKLMEMLPNLLPSNPVPVLLHGDLWTGNIHFSGDRGFLIDPASYYGHSEVDLAMLELFGSFTGAFLGGYGPIDPDYHTRRPIYQIWPALVHVHLFGRGYHDMLDRLLRQLNH